MENLKGTAGRPFQVFLVEDNQADIRLTEQAFTEAKIPYRMEVATDGEQAVQQLERAKSGAWRPDLILLDLNLPRLDGRDVLRALKNDDQLRDIPVIVLTTSRDHRDVAGAYDLHANCFITKPANVHEFFDLISSVERFWLKIARLPSK